MNFVIILGKMILLIVGFVFCVVKLSGGFLFCLFV